MGGEWRNLSGVVPVTARTEEFAGLEHVDPEKPRLGGRRTAPAGNVKGGRGSGSSASSLEEREHGVPVHLADMPAYPAQPMPYKSPVYQALPPQGGQ